MEPNLLNYFKIWIFSVYLNKTIITSNITFQRKICMTHGPDLCANICVCVLRGFNSFLVGYCCYLSFRRFFALKPTGGTSDVYNVGWGDRSMLCQSEYTIIISYNIPCIDKRRGARLYIVCFIGNI